MANYAVTTHVTDPGSATEVAAALETLLEAVDTTKVIRLIQVVEDSRNKDELVGVLIIDT